MTAAFFKSVSYLAVLRFKSLRYLLLIFFITTLSTSVFPQTEADSTEIPLRVWLFLDESKLSADNTQPIIFPEKTLNRLNKKGLYSDNLFSNSEPSKSIYDQISLHVYKINYYSRSLRAYSAIVYPSQIQALEQLPIIRQIQAIRTFKKKPIVETAESSKILNKSEADQPIYGNTYAQLAQLNIPAAHDSGYTGRNVRIAIIDAGFYKDHAAFKRIIDDNRLIAERDFIFNDNNVQDEIHEDTTSGGAQANHGTSVWSVIGGYEPYVYIGAAYNAEFLLAKTEKIGSESIIEEDRFVAAVEWAEACGADIISSSVAYRDFDNAAEDYFFEDLDGKTSNSAKAINWAFERGVLPVISAGNDAQRFLQDGGLLTPSDAHGALTVGAVDHNGQIAGFSSHGPTTDGRIKPDLCALGVYTYVASASSASQYRFRSGTSFATPLIAGAAALLMEKFPDLPPAQIIERLKKYASLSDSPDNRYGWGIPNTFRSLFEKDSSFIPNFYTEKTISAFPNPALQEVTFFFQWTNTIPLAATTTFFVHNSIGQTVWKYSLTPKIAGLNEQIVWSLKNPQGKGVSSGVYFLSVKDGDKFLRGKLLVLR
ncbi:MAG: S8 family peptidase [Candidatus Marinimicrobia bacterium]|nr:S8 family peptidase [Candidatus Neomarinimicrobiota bacterium]